MRVVAASGWGQPHDALRDLLPEADHVDYVPHMERGLEVFKAHRDADLAVGWSMGGQMLVRAVAGGVIAPKKLVLIATPFQFVEQDGLKIGMKTLTFGQYRDNFVSNPHRTFNKSYALIAYRDSNGFEMACALERARERLNEHHDWLYWLDVMAGFSCRELDFSGFPPTLLIHGDQDAVIAHEQSRLFDTHLPTSELLLLEGCGHAPHWHAPDIVQQSIKRFCA